ncbi:DUF2971 domain-containing protein [Vibrio astriarenae]
MALYKFQAGNLNSLTALKKSSLYFSSLNNFNDPTEALFGLQPAEDQVDPTCIPDIDSLKQSSVLCMATDEGNQNIESNLLMWTHYGGELSGICLVFDDNCFKKSLETQGCDFHQKVTYGFPRLLSEDQMVGEHMGIENVSGSPLLAINRKRLMESFIFNKPECFEYENEYRFISERVGLIEYDSKSLVKIIIGEKMQSQGLKDFFIETAKSINPAVRVYKALVKKNSFRICVEECL